MLNSNINSYVNSIGAINSINDTEIGLLPTQLRNH